MPRGLAFVFDAVGCTINLFIYHEPTTKSVERGQWEKSGCCNYDSAMPLLHWLKLHKKRQMRLKGKCQKHAPLKIASSQQRRAILNAGWPTALGSGKKGCVCDKTGATPFFIGCV
jgi:hypothetical protein